MDKVIFFYDKDGSDVFAYFPGEKYNGTPGLHTCYMHVGQHSACSSEYIKECRLAPVDAYQDLKKELISQVGYELDILNEKQFEYHRGPTPYEIKFGEGATHYKELPFAQVYKWSFEYWDLKAWTVCPEDNLRYYKD